MEENKVCTKGILKNSDENQTKKSFKWDEMNIMATYHPPNKTYGHMKIDEPKTPYVFESDDNQNVPTNSSFTPEELAARLESVNDDSDLPQVMKVMHTSDSEEEHAKQFKEKRKLHYNEFYALKLSKEDPGTNDDDDDDELRQHDEEAARNAQLNARLSCHDINEKQLE